MKIIDYMKDEQLLVMKTKEAGFGLEEPSLPKKVKFRANSK